MKLSDDGNLDMMRSASLTPSLNLVVKYIKSMQEEESPIICVSSLVICCNPNVEVIPSILELSYVVLSPLNQRFEIVLKSPRTTVKKGL